VFRVGSSLEMTRNAKMKCRSKMPNKQAVSKEMESPRCIWQRRVLDSKQSEGRGSREDVMSGGWMG
jgi:hypothetical protein